MGVSLIPIGGYGEVGRNCTAIDVDGDIFLFDLGLHVDNYVRLCDDDDVNYRLSKRLLTKEDAVPDLSVIDTKRVKAVLISHAHLDHVGAIPWLGSSFPKASIHATPFTVEVARGLIIDKRKDVSNELVSHAYNQRFRLTDTVDAEFVEVTHSTPQSAAIVLHTLYGSFLYINDFKLDPKPFLGNITDFARLEDIKPKALIIDTLYADVDEHTLGEEHAKDLLESALLSRDLSGKNVLVTTFSSQVSRLKTIADIAKKMGRKVMFIGRSIAKYLEAAQTVGITDIIDDNESIRFGSTLIKQLGKLDSYSDYVFVVTGGMAESKAVLSRIVDQGLIPFKRGDLVVFSNRVIPTPSIIEARERLEHKLRARGFEVLKDLHVSGHGAGKDHRLLLDRIKPEFLVPVHGESHQREAFRKLALAVGYDDDHILILKNAQRFDFD